MKTTFKRITVFLKGPLGPSGDNCGRRFEWRSINKNSGTIGPLSWRLVSREYPDRGLEMSELRIRNCWGATLLLHGLSAEISSDKGITCSQRGNTRDRIFIKSKNFESIVFFPPHYWNDGYFETKDSSIKVTFFQAGKSAAPLPLYPGNERVFLIFRADKATGNKTAKLWKYLEEKKFRPLPGHKIMMSHMHTRYSDGKGTLLENAGYIRKAGIDIGLWTDHDTSLKENAPAKLEEETAMASNRNFLAISRPELSSNLWDIPEQKGKLMDHGCYLTPETAMHFGSRKKNGKLCAAEGALDIVAKKIAKMENGVCWLAHPSLSRTPEELIDGWNKYVSMMEWSNYEWIIGKNCAALFRHSENFGALFFNKLDMLLDKGFDVGIISGVDFHNIRGEDYVFDNGVVNYLGVAQLNTESVASCLKKRCFFVSTGEVLPTECRLEDGKVIFKIDTVFPLRNIVITTEKGKMVHPVSTLAEDGKIKLDLKELAPEKWWRTEIWDIANNPAFTQPVRNFK